MSNMLDGVVQPEGPNFIFASAFGGGSQSGRPPLIHSKLLALRKEVNHIAAKRQPGVPFPVRGAKDLAQKLAEALVRLDLLAPVVHQEVVLMDTDPALVGTNKSGGPRFSTMAHVKATVRMIAEDGSYIDMVGSGHGADGDDKAGGKASTYAWKDAILKGLTIPDAEMADTDDDSGDSYDRGPKVVKDPPKATPKVKQSTDEIPDSRLDNVVSISDAKKELRGLKYTVEAIEKAKTLEDLEMIKKAIASGDIILSGGDKLSASAAYVARRKELKEGPQGPSAA